MFKDITSGSNRLVRGKTLILHLLSVFEHALLWPVEYLFATPFYNPNSFYMLRKRLCAKKYADEKLKYKLVEDFLKQLNQEMFSFYFLKNMNPFKEDNAMQLYSEMISSKLFQVRKVKTVITPQLTLQMKKLIMEIWMKASLHQNKSELLFGSHRVKSSY